MADCEELEDGEVLDSDTDDQFTPTAQAQAPPSLAHAEPRQRYPNPSIYRDRTKAKNSSSDSDNDSDEEKFLWKRKRLKYAAAKERDGSGDSRSGAAADHANFLSNLSPSNQSGAFPIMKPKKKKDIWGAVLQEQSLSQGFIGFDMERKSKGYNDRSVEAYAFERAETDTRPFFDAEAEEEGKEQPETKNGDLFSGPPDLDQLEENFMGGKKQGTKRKYPVKERLGPREFNKRKSREHYKATASDPVKVVSEAVAKMLQEPRDDLVLKVVRTMGRKKTLELAYITEDIEGSGGMLTNDGSRRRTPGGVFFQLLKTDPSFTKDKMKDVFGEEMKKEAKRKKKLRAKRIKQKLSKDAEDGDTMETETAAADDASAAKGEPQNKNIDDDCDDDDSNETSRGSSNTSICAADPTTMDLTELLKHHVERRRVEDEEEKKKAAAANKEKGMQLEPEEMEPKEPAPILEPELCLDDESEMTFDL